VAGSVQAHGSCNWRRAQARACTEVPIVIGPAPAVATAGEEDQERSERERPLETKQGRTWRGVPCPTARPGHGVHATAQEQ
jgi:hypothetical protein